MTRGGIRTLGDIRARCVEEGDCWLWRMAVRRNRPQANLGGKVVFGPRITAVVMGKAHLRQPDQRWYVQCGEPTCLSPKCLRLGTHKEAHSVASKAGRLRRDAIALVNNSRARMKRPDVRPEWMVEWAMESPQSSREVGAALGVHPTTVRAWRNGSKRNAQRVGMFAQLLRMGA